MKITPAHDPNDFEIGLRHHLAVINIMDDGGNINENGGKYAGLSGMEARKRIVRDLKEQGFLVRTEPIKHNVGACYRCGTIVEPRVSRQWFVKMKPLAEPAIRVVQEGKIRFVPDRFSKIYYHWMENIRDWCISRQLWWGHRIPAWYCQDCGETIVAREAPHVCPKCGGTHLKQDPDTLDTWFSSALWPFSTLGWPDRTPDFKYFYPTDTLVTGYDIIFFWVARMIFSAVEQTGEAPFHTVLIHGLVRDEQGRKMSKSLGNGIDPLKIIGEYGADALRFMLATGNSPGNDMRFSKEKVQASRNFANKIWNAARFIRMNMEGHEVPDTLPETLTRADRWILDSFNRLVKEVTENLEHFELGIAVQKLYDFLWDEFCDWYIEISKIRLNYGDEEAAQNARRVLAWVMSSTMRLLHPFMPFITEEIWQALPHEGESIMVARWPQYREELCFPQDAEEMRKVMDAVRAVRNRRSEMNVPPSRRTHLYIATASPDTFRAEVPVLKRLAWASQVEIGAEFDPAGAVTLVTPDAQIFIPTGELVDPKEELARLEKELAGAQKRLGTAQAKLRNEKFLNKAPAPVVQGVRQNAVKLSEHIALIESGIRDLQR